MDDFAQSREPDDLFADEIEPADEEPTYESPKIQPDSPVNSIVPTAPTQYQQGGQIGGGRGATGPRGGRGRGRGRGGPGSRGAPQASQPSQVESVSRVASNPPSGDVDSTDASPPSPPADVAIATAQPSAVNEQSRITSVRGDRSATGPAKPTKRSPAELDELMSSMKLKNAAKTKAFERSEKDQATFLQRQQQAAAKQKEETKAIREQDMEREKNRLRKMKAQGVREWDSEKQESDIVDRSRGNSSGYTRGAHGGVSGTIRGGRLAASRYGGDEEDLFAAKGEGRGELSSRTRGSRSGRGNRGGRGRGGDTTSISQTAPQDIDFPALPGATKHSTSAPSKPAGGLGASSWAEEMATPIEEKSV